MGGVKTRGVSRGSERERERREKPTVVWEYAPVVFTFRVKL
jgi:hypothetical protein